jgi:hypothetical protein
MPRKPRQLRARLQQQHDRGEADGRAGENKPPHGFWETLASRLGLLTKRVSRKLRLDNMAYQAGRKLGKSRRD